MTQVLEPNIIQPLEHQTVKFSPPISRVQSPPREVSRLRASPDSTPPPWDPPRVPGTDGSPGVGLVIGSELANPDPVSTRDKVRSRYFISMHNGMQFP